MKHLILLLTLLLLLTPFSFAQTKNGKANGKSLKRELTTEGSTVLVIVNHVKPNKREQFEKFIFEVLASGVHKQSPAEQKAFRQFRVLTPTGPNEEGNYDYLFIMDPALPSVDYSLDNALKKMYGEEKASQYLKMFEESLAGPQVTYITKQSRL